MNKKGFAIINSYLWTINNGSFNCFHFNGNNVNNKSNNREFSKIVEDELNRFSRTEVNLAPSGSNTQIYTVPQGESGWYRIELWGAPRCPNGGLEPILLEL